MNLGMLIETAFRMMTKRFVHNAYNSGVDISLDQWQVLGPIWQLKSPSQKIWVRFVLRIKLVLPELLIP